MDFIHYTFLTITVALAIPAGIIIAKNSEEELKDGSRYIKTLMMVSLYLAMLLTSKMVIKNTIISVICPTLAILALFYVPIRYRPYVAMFLSGLSISLSIKGIGDAFLQNYFVPSLIFISFICIGSMTYQNAKNSYVNSALIKMGVFFIVSLSLFFI